jgi:hypothetical protein
LPEKFDQPIHSKNQKAKLVTKNDAKAGQPPPPYNLEFNKKPISQLARIL